MGAWIFTLFGRKRQKPHSEELAELHKELTEAEDYKYIIERSEKRISRNFLWYSLSAYVIIAAISILFFPSNVGDRALTIFVLAGTPTIFWFLWKVVKWFYVSRIIYAEERLQNLKRRKRKLLDEIKSTESYRTVQDILKKYSMGDSSNDDDDEDDGEVTEDVEVECVVQRRSSFNQKVSYTPPPPLHSTPLRPAHFQIAENQLPVECRKDQPQLVRALISPNRGILIRIFEVLAQAGPQHRYALICTNCSCHNGMAFPEEIDSLEYKCAFCGFFNPSRRATREKTAEIVGGKTESQEQ
ncbi:hypothetical protein ACOME3_002675 [Neoechinorhynchus agilis]